MMTSDVELQLSEMNKELKSIYQVTATTSFEEYDDDKHAVKDLKVDLETLNDTLLTTNIEFVTVTETIIKDEVDEFNSDNCASVITTKGVDLKAHNDPLVCIVEDTNERHCTINQDNSEQKHMKQEGTDCQDEIRRIVENPASQDNSEKHPPRKRKSTREKPFACTFCDQTFARQAGLIRHQWIHTGEKPFACTYCRNKFSRKTDLSHHMQIHSIEKPFACTVCNYKSTHKRGLMNHMKVHTVEKNFSCATCGYKTSQELYLKKHIERQHKKTFYCDACGRKFYRQARLTNHLKVHIKQFNCTMCGLKCTTFMSLCRHLKTHRLSSCAPQRHVIKTEIVNEDFKC